jgi:hypothetical protein
MYSSAFGAFAWHHFRRIGRTKKPPEPVGRFGRLFDLLEYVSYQTQMSTIVVIVK